MDVATSVESATSVGVRELKNQLSRYLALVADGEEVVVTDRGRPVARLVAIDAPTDRYHRLVEAGIIRPATKPGRPLPTPVRASGSVSDLVAEQRR